MQPDLSDNLQKSIEARRDEMVALTQELVRFPTVNPPGEGYRECAEFIGRRLSGRGLVIDDVVNSATVMALAARTLLLGNG